MVCAPVGDCGGFGRTVCTVPDESQ